MAVRLTPYDLVFAPLADERFPAIRAALNASGREARDRDAFLLTPEAPALVRDLRPDEGLGEAIDQLVALVHHAYLFWAAGCPLTTLTAGDFEQLLTEPAEPNPAPTGPRAEGAGARYVQIPERRLWAQPISGGPFEPMDGCFLHAAPDGTLRVLGVFGVHPDRLGFTVVEAQGVRPEALARADGSPLFAPTLPRGTDAGLYTIVGAEELVELGWRLAGVPDAKENR